MRVTKESDTLFEPYSSDNVELAHGGLLSPTALIKPLPVGRVGQNAAVLAAAAVGLMGYFRLPVLEAYADARLIHPVTFFQHVVDAQPDVFLRPDGLADVGVELVVLITGQRSAEGATHGDAIIISCVEVLLHRVCQETLARNLDALQAH